MAIIWYIQLIAYASLCQEQLRVSWIIFEFLSQPADMDI